MKKFSYILLVLVVIACKPSRPPGIISPGDMEDVLYDMHVAQAVYESREGEMNDKDIIPLRASVLRKHGFTQDEWEDSYSYYSRNTRELFEIYQEVSDRVGRNLVALGGKVEGVQEDIADTANVWKDSPSFILMHQSPYNLHTFEILPDSTFEDGDRITLQFDMRTIFQDGIRDVVSVLAVYYSNDSLATNVSHTMMDGHGVVTINNDVDRLHITKIKGYIMLAQDMTQQTTDQNSTVMRLASISNVKLLHLRTLPPATSTPQPSETLDSVALLRRDSLRRDSIIKDSIKTHHPAVVNPAIGNAR